MSQIKCCDQIFYSRRRSQNYDSSQLTQCYCISVLLQNDLPTLVNRRDRNKELQDVVTAVLLHGAVTDHNSDGDGRGWI